MKRLSSLLLISSSALALLLGAQLGMALPKKTKKVLPIAGEHIYILANGLKLIVKPDHRAPVAALQIWYKVGSSYEPAGRTGISHVLEHMMFKGTTRFPGDTFSRTVAKLGGQENAGTTDDFTFYFQTIAAKHLATSMKLEADRMQNLTFNDNDFKKEIKVVMEERRMRTDNRPQAVTQERFMAAAFIASPYHHPVVGWMRDLQNLNLAAVKNWYQKWYAPNNALVVVVGDVKPEAVHQLARRYFGPLTPKKLIAPRNGTDVAPLGERTVTVRQEAKLPSLIIGYNTPSLPSGTRKDEGYVLEVISGILSSGQSSRLKRELVRQQRIATSISTDYDLYARLPKLFTITGIPTKDNSVQTLRAAIAKQIHRLQTTPVTAEELARVKAQVIASNVYLRDSMYYQALLRGMLWAVGLDSSYIEKYVSHIQAVTPAQIQRVAKDYFTEQRRTIAVLKPLANTSEEAR